ncbi:hypothetical protein S83_019453, partial [Arachis hypogaea]
GQQDFTFRNQRRNGGPFSVCLFYSISVNTTTTISKERFGLKRKIGTSLVYLINKE